MSRFRHGLSAVTSIGVALVLSASLTACSSTTKSTSGSGGDSAGAALQKAMDSFVAQPVGPPGIVVALGNGSQLTVRTAGLGNRETKTPPTADNYMRLASVAKAFSGATALALVADKKLALSDTIGKWLPGLPQKWSSVNLGELLGHTSGIPDFSQTKAFAAAVTAAPQKPPAHRTLLTFAAPTLAFTPGQRYAYSNSDNIIVALMIEAATHQSYEEVLAQKVLVPLQLHQTSLPNSSAIQSPTMVGYDISSHPIENVTSVFAAGWSWASGGVVSTPADALRFVRGYVKGVLTTASARAAQFTFRAGTSEPPGPGTNSAGLALFKYQTSCGTVYGHTGNTPGYTQFIAASSDGKQAVTVSVNAQITPKTNAAQFSQLRHIWELAVCASR